MTDQKQDQTDSGATKPPAADTRDSDVAVDGPAPETLPPDANDVVEDDVVQEDVVADDAIASSDLAGTDTQTAASETDAEKSSETAAPEPAELSEQADQAALTDADQNAALPAEPEAELEAETEPEETDPPAPVRSGRGIAWFGVLLALLALGGAAYLYYQLVWLDPLGNIAQQREVAQQRIDQVSSALDARLAEIREAQSKALAEASADTAAQLRRTETGVRKSLTDALQAAPPSQREWKIAEAEYLLRIANHRVLMEQDSRGALQLLLATDAIMQELDDFALHGVRARLADEILSLRQVPRDDLQGIYLRLEAVKTELNRLTYFLPEFEPEPAPAAAEAAGVDKLLEVARGFFRVRPLNSNDPLQPLLAPEEEQYLELNLRLALEQAQLAALKRDQTVYEHALGSAREWMQRFLPARDDGNAALLQELDELLALQLAHPLPDISGSLAELLNVRRGGGQ